MRTIKNYNRAFKGVWIPAEIWLHPDLSIYEAVLLTEISSLDNENGCYASNEYFANFLGVTERSISEIISKLKELNLIEQTVFDGRNRVLKIKEGRKNFYSATTKVLPSIYNNTNINTNRDISKDISGQLA